VTGRARYGLAAIVLLAAAAAGVLVWRHGTAPAARTVKVDVYGTQAVTSAQQPGIGYSGNGGHMVPPNHATATGQQSLTDASVVLTTPGGQSRQTGQTLPWERTVTLQPGQQVSVSVQSTGATSLECTITVDGTQLAKQATTHPGTLTCDARP
jgi:hypothetical protein